ncbi:uncharacterized protein LOC110982587 [Acanthaster planci]|uniref:Uncharacterized protein LOC110982587 n=1 Tax=Acanthaster planci TaxID=133434 RepID=A0A8B7YWD0_ACAPL|nr:uncharacterized protein LOC110982587 [Acanthaster planci]
MTQAVLCCRIRPVTPTPAVSRKHAVGLHVLLVPTAGGQRCRIDFTKTMGCAVGKQDDDAPNDPQSAQQEMKQQEGSSGTKVLEEEIRLQNPSGSGDAVHFQAWIGHTVGPYTLTNVTANGLASMAGLRRGDQLIGMNGQNIEKYSLEHVLYLLCEDIETKLLLELKRTDGGITKYVWSFFELSIREGNPVIQVIQLLETHIDAIPTEILDAAISWIGAPVNAVEIYLPDENLYLGIDDEKLSFMKHDKDKCTFYRYNYEGGDSSQGNIVAYTQQNFKPPPTDIKNTPATTNGTSAPELFVEDFPSSMVTQLSFPPDPRLWYEKIDTTGDQEGRTLQSMTQQEWYLARDPANNAAILSKYALAMSILPVELPIVKIKTTEEAVST